jgi:multidrug efflux pump subunit AcrB
MSLISFGVQRPVVSNLVMFAIIAGGLLFGLTLRKEFFPEVRPTQVLVFAPYPGASPEEVEKSLVKKIEDRVADLDDVEEVTTTVLEGACRVLIEFKEGVSIDRAVFDVKREMDALQDLPEESERIIVEEFEPNIPTIVVSLFGDGDEREMKRAIRAIREDLRSLPGMGDITETGVRTDEISVEVRPEALLAHGLSLPAVSDRVRQAMIELPGGAVRSGTANVAMRTMGADDRSDEVRSIVVRAGGDGQVVRLDEIAEVREGFADVDQIARLNGKPAMSLTVFKTGDDDAVKMSEMVKAYVAGRNGEEIELTLGERLARLVNPGAESTRIRAYSLGVSRTDALPGSLTTTTDLARFIVGRLELLSRNAAQGAVLVMLTLVLLLDLRSAFWVTTGMVVALLGTLVMMSFVGISLNLLTMFGLIIVVGMLVDDGIVVAENIASHHERGTPALDAAVRGTREVIWPVVGTVLTTITAFMPLTLIEGRIGDLMGVLPGVVVCALAVSLLEVSFILPSHMGHSFLAAEKRRASGKHGLFLRFEMWLKHRRDGWFAGWLVPWYGRIAAVCVRRRYVTVATSVGLIIVSLGMVAGGRVPFVFLGTNDAETVNIAVRMPVGTPLEETDRVVRVIEAAVAEQPEVTSFFASIGAASSLDGESASASSNLAQLILELKPVELRDRSSEQVRVAIRERVGVIPGVESVRMEDVAGGPEGPPISIGVTGDSMPQLEAAAADIAAMVSEFAGVYDVADDNDTGRREMRIRLREGADELGFTTEMVARQLRGWVFGLEASTFAGDREDVDVRVMLPEDYRRSLAAIEEMHLVSPAGLGVPVMEVCAIEEVAGYATLRRLDRSRIIEVTAEVDSAVTNVEQVTAELAPRLAELETRYPGVAVVARGRQKDVAESFATLPLGMVVAMGVSYVILVWLFQKYGQPLFVLTAIPFSIVGVVWGHLLLGFDMTILSLIGFIALSGVVVNDSIVFMEFYNHRRRDGLPVADAVVETGRARIRAVLLTTITTVAGLLPLMLEQSFQARFLIPMAITISFGLISSTIAVLLVLPSVLVIAEDIGLGLRWIWTGRKPVRAGSAPAGELSGAGAV